MTDRLLFPQNHLRGRCYSADSGNPQVRAFAQKMGWLYYEYVLALHFISYGRSCGLSPSQAIHSDIAARCERTDSMKIKRN